MSNDKTTEKIGTDSGGGSVLDDWLDAPTLLPAYAYRIYHPDTDTITYGLTRNKSEALKLDAYPIELLPTLLMR